MKTLILSLAIVAIFASCSSNTGAVEDPASLTAKTLEDTTGLAQFKQWKENRAFADPELINSETINTEAINEPVQPPPVVVYKTAPAREQKVAKVTKSSSRATKKPVARTKAPRPETTTYPNTSTGDSSPGGSGTSVETGNGNEDIASAPAEVPQAKKEGWSKAAKGTAIGAGSGAVLGAIISKNKTKGAVIGGVIGAAGGYILGRKQDKNDGRY